MMNEHTPEEAPDQADKNEWVPPVVETLSMREVYAVLDTQGCGSPSGTNDPDCNAN